MKPTENDTVNDNSIIENVMIHVIGPNMLQNELLTSFLEDNLGIACRQYEMLDPELKAALDPGQRNLLLIDCLGEKEANPWTLYHFNGFKTVRHNYFAFYNVHPEAGIENKAIEFGIHGLFYHNESFKVLPKAISAILEGELWFSRKTMSQCLKNGHAGGNRISTDMASCLTEREREILIRIATGVGNQQIADELCISLHTVKTHIYNIYKKINVKNRLQASLWAARYV
jgi:DNA-binding CsgD family transcriptional regulator